METILSKVCCGCKETKLGTAFGRKAKNKDGLQTQCRECLSMAYRMRPKILEVPEFKICFTCKTNLPQTSFYRLARSSDGLHSNCKQCERSYESLRLSKTREAKECVVCAACKVLKPSKDFCKDNHRTNGLSAYCRDCRSKEARLLRSTQNGVFRGLLNHSKKNAVHRSKVRDGLRAKTAGIHAISINDLEHLYRTQEGLCHYSGLKMRFERKVSWKMSLERRDPSQGYTKENIALVCCEFNGFKNWTPEKIESLRNEIFSAHSPATYEDFLKVPQNHTSRDDYMTIWHNSPRGYVSTILRSSKHCAINEGYNGEHSLTFEQIVQKYFKQKGRCAYSQIPLRFKKGDFRLSLERVNVNGTYTDDNVLLICQEFNLPGSARWTREKFEYFWANKKN